LLTASLAIFLDFANRRVVALRRVELRGDLGGVFHHLVRLAVQIKNRIVGGLNPDILATLADALVFPRLILATIEVVPERAIGAAITLGGRHEHAVMPALDFAERIAEKNRIVGRKNPDLLAALADPLVFPD
jgi:hypothetical protein